MNLLPWPKDWSGSSPMAAWMKRLLNRCKQESFLESKDFRRIQTNNGYFIESNKKSSSGGTAQTVVQIEMFAITGLTGLDYFIGQQLTGINVNLGDNVVEARLSPTPTLIAKSVPARKGIAVEVIDGVPITYRDVQPGNPLTGYADNNRIANDGVSDEVQVLYPRYVQLGDPTSVFLPGSARVKSDGSCTSGAVWCGGQSVIYAAQIDGGAGVHQLPLSIPGAAPVNWVELLPARVWAKRFAV